MIESGVYTSRYPRSAAQSTAQQRLGTPLLVQRMIETATAHADAGGFGEALLSRRGHSWVLSRLSVEMSRYPRIHEDYELRSWVTSLNRRFSERCFEIVASGKVAGHARTVWAAIDTAERKGADLTDVMALAPEMRPDLTPGMEPMPRLAMPQEWDDSYDYRCRVTDLDFNRHLTTVRYVELLVGQCTLHELDTHLIGRLDIAFAREAREGDLLRVSRAETPAGRVCALTGAEGGELYAQARLRLDPAR